MKKAVIILPTYNEADNIKKVIDSIFEVTHEIKNWTIDLLVVDSSSPDKTADVVKEMQKKNRSLHLLSTPKEGLGKAYIAGFNKAIDEMKAYLVFEMDADLSHPPKDIPKFLEKIEQGADFVIGSRYIPGGSIPSDWGLDRKIYSVLANIFIKYGFMKLSITDWTSGFRAIKSWLVKSALPYLNHYSGYVFQVAILDNAIKQHAVIKEVPLNFVDRKNGVSKINSFQYIVQTLFYVLTHSSFIKFGLVGVIGFIIDFGISFILIEKVGKPIWLSTIISTETAIISNFLFNNFWSFSHKRLDNNPVHLIWNFIKFNVVSSGSIIIQTVLIHYLAVLFGERLWFVYKFFVIGFVIIPYSYVLYNKIIWKDKK